MAEINRRDFLKYLGVAAGASVLGVPLLRKTAGAIGKQSQTKPGAAKRATRLADGIDTEVDPTKRWGYVIDAGACIGCRRCQWACKQENNVPDTLSPPWIEVFQLDGTVDLTGNPTMEELRDGATTDYTKSPLEGKRYLPVQCNHCDNPPCVKVCPTGATYKDKDGLVLIDYDRCVGCRFCVVSCPYGNRRFNWVKPELAPENINPKVPVRPVGVPEKCTFCVHRVRNGLLPRCVEVCPVNARHFGDLNDPNSEVSKLLKENLSIRLLEELTTKPRIWYITRGKKYLG